MSSRHSRLLVAIISLLLLGFAVVFCTFPRSAWSELERRELRRFPDFSWEHLCDGSFTADVSAWFSDSEPYRDALMSLSMRLRAAQALHWGEEETVTFHASADERDAMDLVDEDGDDFLSSQRDIEQYQHHDTPDAQAKLAHAGVIVLGHAPHARALMAFKGKERGAAAYARAVNRFHDALGPDVRIYCMVIPTAVEYYCPAKAQSLSAPEFPVLSHLYASLHDSVQAVDVYTPLGEHAHEPIYLRTDHHWAPLGAYYAACQFARVAGVHVPVLADFESRSVPDYVGSMYGFSQDPAVKQSPEEFVFYTPRDTAYDTHYTIFHLDEDFNIEQADPECEGDFFYADRVSSGNAYCTFMGSDARITRVTTRVSSDRRLLILKDSFGNALPSYLFGSFREVHVIDFRYFPYSLRQYVSTYGITDLLFANNIAHACSGAATRAYLKMIVE